MQDFTIIWQWKKKQQINNTCYNVALTTLWTKLISFPAWKVKKAEFSLNVNSFITLDVPTEVANPIYQQDL